MHIRFMPRVVMLAACALCAGAFSVCRAQTTFVEAAEWRCTAPQPVDDFAHAAFPAEESTTFVSRADWKDGTVRVLTGANNVVTYLTRELNASEACTVPVELGSDDGIKVWLNGIHVFTNDVARDLKPRDKIDLFLAPGKNTLQLAVHNRQGGHAFFFRIDQMAVTPGWAGLSDGIQQRVSSAQAADWPELQANAHAEGATLAKLNRCGLPALRRAVQDLSHKFPEHYTRGPEFLSRIDQLEQRALKDESEKLAEACETLRREALLANPLLDFNRMLVVKRSEKQLGLPQNWQGNCSLPLTGYDNEVGVLTLAGEYKTIYRPDNSSFVGDLDLFWDADRMLLTMMGSHDKWQIWEMAFKEGDACDLRQVTIAEEPDVNNYDACYLPDGRIIFDSTRVFQGIPCVSGSDAVANLFIMNADGTGVRQLCFDQDHDWNPTVLNNGRVLYTRWEYSDTPHYFTRLLFHMNPDGTSQMQYYGSNSYWPNSTFYSRPIPGEPTKIVSIISGHHGVARAGELVVFDPARGRKENEGIVTRIPGHGKPVTPHIMDELVADSWPRFLHPFPLDADYFIVSCKPDQKTPWGIYLVDTFDNMIKIYDTPGYAMFEAIPFRKSHKPPVVPDKVNLETQEGTVYLSDVYKGEGLKGVPRGTVKSLRLYEFHYSYNKMGGHINIGVEGPWDVHRILGTVPVLEDGSAVFRVPANMPIAVQPLDQDGRELQIMRSWFVAMPGEVLSCVGCHEEQSMAPPSMQTLAARRPPVEIQPWLGPARGFSWNRDVQPVLDKYCVSCHNGEGGGGKDLRAQDPGWKNFPPSYLELHPYVRRPGPESDYRLQEPMEFHASTSELIQMLEKGHGRVKLDEEAMDRLATWIDLNVPALGTWGEEKPIPDNYHQRRIEMRTKYANRPEDPEAIPALNMPPIEPVAPAPKPEPAAKPELAGWPFDNATAKQLQANAGAGKRTVDIGNGVTMDFVLIPAGEFVMGGVGGWKDEQPATVVKVEKPFWMATTEVTNRQFQQFDPRHFNGVIDQHSKDHTTPGYPIDDPDMPAVRMTWFEANEFCKWMSQKAGATCSLPTEAQWEWACRAGTDTPLNYGDLDTDFAKLANLGDASLKLLAVAGINPQPIKNPTKYDDFLPKEARFNDGCKLMSKVAAYEPNAWGLFDMHGNVCEWTSSDYKPYPYNETDGRNALSASEKKVVRGGSWFDRPKRATSSFRIPYQPYQPVYNVGLRVVMAAE